MGIPVKLQAFEGPLDLLLHLIDKNKVNIYDIPIVEITRQYLEYVGQMDRQDLDVVSEFLVMAATLLDIKSKMLLPKEIKEDGEEEDPREELVQKLLEYKMYKYMSYELKDREIEAEKSFFKKPTIPEEVLKYQEPVDIDALFDGITLSRLNEIFRQVMRQRENKIDPIRSTFRNIEREEVSLPDKINFIRDYAQERKQFSFQKLLESQHSKMHVVVSFLAILELMKMGEITIEQNEIFGEIIVTVKERQEVFHEREK